MRHEGWIKDLHNIYHPTHGMNKVFNVKYDQLVFVCEQCQSVLRPSQLDPTIQNFLPVKFHECTKRLFDPNEFK